MGKTLAGIRQNFHLKNNGWNSQHFHLKKQWLEFTTFSLKNNG
jgi:hypothetical protein